MPRLLSADETRIRADLLLHQQSGQIRTAIRGGRFDVGAGVSAERNIPNCVEHGVALWLG